ncbi:class I SAM-dependent methyltransferase [Archaeoglobus neptunius]|uniref:class I SAM-dependent methyltransferase n=1 Tax=Archaeoglobus neptunius TaxID=2798580 RepID=UPI001927DA3B|nr:class I SAM-dependent methyltransferase [Archaeoglobus neptunius]
MKSGFFKNCYGYEKYATVQKSASEILLKLLKIGENDDVLDLGCGTGHLTRKIRSLTKGRVVGIDPSEGMIREAIEKSKGLDITYEIKSAENMDYEEGFDVIFCNSAFQWFKDPEKAIKNCYRSLKRSGRIGTQAPAKKIYCPNFIEAIEMMKRDKRTEKIFAHFREPWFFLETAEEYKSLFERCGFKVMFSITTEHTPEDVFKILSSGAIAGYLNQDCYEVELTEDYISAFMEIVKKAFERQSDENGMVKLKFNRVFLIAVKE